METPKPKGMFLPVLMMLMVLANPMWLWASTDGSDAVAKLQQLRSAQNKQTMIANMKAKSIDVSKRTTEIPSTVFKKALKENSSRQMPEISTSSAPGFHRITPAYKDEQVASLTAAISSVYYGQGKLTYASPDSMYFNFLSEMNGFDTTGMDITITIGTGMIFGDDGSFGSDISWVAFYSAYGDLDTVDVVPTIDDPSLIWTDVSGDSVSVGELWLIYTRTSHMYVVLQVTGTSEDSPDEHITFDYMIQTNGSNIFTDEPLAPPVDITVNGLDADTLYIGSEPFFSITLGAATEGSLIVSWDRNHNGITDTMDIPIEEYEFSDNDMHDLNPVDGIFDFIYDNEMADGLNYVIDDFLYTVYTEDGIADAAVRYYTDPTPFSVSGTALDSLTGEPLEGIVVWGDYAWFDMEPMPEEEEGPTIIAITDTAGQYTLFFPDTGHVVIGSWDHLMVTDGLIPEPKRYEFDLYGSEALVDFYYREPHAYIEGYVHDETMTPLVDVEVRAFFQGGEDGDGGDFFGYTDETGYYEIGVDPGWFWVEVDGKDLIPDYMIPEGQDLEVTEAGPNNADFALLIPNSFISGTVYLDGAPLPETMVHAWHWDFGWNVVGTDASGYYEIPVYDPAAPTVEDDIDGYSLGVFLEDIPYPVVQVSENWNVAPGTTGEDIYLESVTGGIYGTFFSNETGEPITDSWNVGMQARNLDTGMDFWAGPDEWDGSYELWLPNGPYEITAGGMDWYGPPPDTIFIEDGMMPYDIFLDPVHYEGIFDGRVLDEMTNNPIPDAEIGIGNEYWGNWTMTDENGYFHFELPNGHYYFQVWAYGYLDYYGEVDINDDYVYMDIMLQELVINGAIGGIVFDPEAEIPTTDGELPGMPVVDAMVHVYNPSLDIGFNTWTDSSGEFWFDLPNGIYDIYVEHPNYLPYWDEGLWVSNDTLIYDVALATADGAITGFIYDSETMEPIWDAGVWIVSTDTTDTLFFMDYYTWVDEDGHFYVPVMNGTYEVHVDAYGYEHVYIPDVFVENEEVFLDISMNKMEFMGPHINYIVDQPNDQGRWVRMEFEPGSDDFGEYMAYSVWRMSNTPMGPMYDFIAYIPNKYMPFYSLVAPTLIDSNAYTEPWEYMTEFVVTGHYDNWNFVDGGPNFGYSVDNIQPGVPLGLTLIGTGDDYNELQWEASADADFQYFELYRSATGDFTDLAPIAQLAELGYRDEDVTMGQSYHYMLKAVDANGNVSDGSTVLTAIVSIDGENQLPTEYSLSQNYPNPFNPSTTITFGLPEASHVTLEIFNVLGQKVRTLTDSNMPAGYINITWDGLDQKGNVMSSGTYIYRLQTNDHSFAKKMVLMR